MTMSQDSAYHGNGPLSEDEFSMFPTYIPNQSWNSLPNVTFQNSQKFSDILNFIPSLDMDWEDAGTPWSTSSAASALFDAPMTDLFPQQSVPISQDSPEPFAPPPYSHYNAPFLSPFALHNTGALYPPPQYPLASPQDAPNDSGLRFRVDLNTKLAFTSSPDITPVTYLNKGQAYKLSIKDTHTDAFAYGRTEYRVSIRISFEYGKASPQDFWRVWKSIRGEDEARIRGPDFKAIEYIGPCPSRSIDSPITVESRNFDGFTFRWATTRENNAQCGIMLRFNFLSTDFNHAVGVKGTPVRLSVKTEQLSPATGSTETSFCWMKLFRTHGAERKTNTDLRHLEKRISKLKKRSELRESEYSGKQSSRIDDSNRESDTDFESGASDMNTSSVDIKNSTELESQLGRLRKQARSMNDPVFFSRWVPNDEPEFEPIDLEDLNADEATAVSKPRASTRKNRNDIPPHISPVSSNQSPEATSVTEQSRPAHAFTPTQSYNEPLDFHPTYTSPPERAVNPTCFYVLRKAPPGELWDEFHQPIYLYNRTLHAFVQSVVAPWSLTATSIANVVRINQDGVCTKVDDAAMQDMADGQDMYAEIKSWTGDVEVEAALGAVNWLILSY